MEYGDLVERALALAQSVEYEELVERALALAQRGQRAILGIAGAPGSGKSTLASAIAQSVNARLNPDSPNGTAVQGSLAVDEAEGHQAAETVSAGQAPDEVSAGQAAKAVSTGQPPAAIVVPMDGFHLAHSVLEERGHTKRKGAIHTFDGWGFLSLIKRLAAADHMVFAPEYRREIEDPIAGAIPVDPRIPLVIVEGNYLLAEGPEWSQVRTYLAESWFIDIDEDVRLERLISRHIRFGRSPQAAREYALGSDQKNAELILETAGKADLVANIQNW